MTATKREFLDTLAVVAKNNPGFKWGLHGGLIRGIVEDEDCELVDCFCPVTAFALEVTGEAYDLYDVWWAADAVGIPDVAVDEIIEAADYGFTDNVDASVKRARADILAAIGLTEDDYGSLDGYKGLD